MCLAYTPNAGQDGIVHEEHEKPNFMQAPTKLEHMNTCNLGHILQKIPKYNAYPNPSLHNFSITERTLTTPTSPPTRFLNSTHNIPVKLQSNKMLKNSRNYKRAITVLSYIPPTKSWKVSPMLSRYLPKKGEHDMKNAFLFFSIKI